MPDLIFGGSLTLYNKFLPIAVAWRTAGRGGYRARSQPSDGSGVQDQDLKAAL